MGWNSWNHFNCDVNETVVRQTADALVDLGLAQAGYVYVNLDDCWQRDRDANGRVIEDHVAFPSGMKALGDYVHSKGLKYGLYSDIGYKTCSGRPGSLGYETIDSNTWAEWGVDYMKVDACYRDATPAVDEFKKLRDAMNATGRPMVFSICDGGETSWEWAPEVGNLWRTTFDIWDKWEAVVAIVDRMIPLVQYARPGAWNDPDMLEVGNGGMTTEEYRSHFTMWAAFKAPLLIGADLNKITPEIVEILANPEVIAINQDPLGKSVELVEIARWSGHVYDIWKGPLADGGYVVVILNRHDKKTQVPIKWKHLAFNKHGRLAVRDLWARRDLGVLPAGHRFETEVPAHGVRMFKVLERGPKIPERAGKKEKKKDYNDDVPIFAVQH
ncbi:hypothetical protein HK102_011462 [Quaeritorhiza haematococci]|nr:hypothetical protein HK102_011462 [Quaeritorhiza haematococci]